MNNKHPIGPDFDPFLACDALLGLAEAMHWQVTEGPASEQPLTREAHAAMIGLSWAARRIARELHAYFQQLSEAGVELPARHRVQETAPPYRMN